MRIMEYIIETRALTKRYGNKSAVDDMSIHIKRGDIYGLIGKNGAGKTTLMKLLLGLTFADRGEIRLFGGSDLDGARRKIGSLIEAPALYRNENAFENMKRFSILAPTPDEEIHKLLAFVGLENTGRKRVREFSLGMRQRLGIAVALLGNPEILVLDEPINGLDPSGIKDIRDMILELNKKGVTFVISSHLLDELGKVATNYGIVSNGVLIEEITAGEIDRKCKTSVKAVTNNGEEAARALRQWRNDLRLENDEKSVFISSEIEDTSEIASVLVNAGMRVYELRNESVGLEDFFIERMGG